MFKPKNTVLAMIQPPPLPGSYKHKNDRIEDIIKKVIDEMSIIDECGFDGVILQNMNDMPIKQIASPEAISYMTRIGYEIKNKYPNIILGVLVNWDGVASVAVAEAIGADFIRVEHLFTGANVTSAGILQAQCVEIANIRKRTKSKIPVYADIYEIHGVPLGKKTVSDAAWEAIYEAFADGIFVSSKTPDMSIEMVEEIRKKLPNTPIMLGGGATGDNIKKLIKYFDGVSVATWIKNGNMNNPIDRQKAKIFLKNVKKSVFKQL